MSESDFSYDWQCCYFWLGVPYISSVYRDSRQGLSEETKGFPPRILIRLLSSYKGVFLLILLIPKPDRPETHPEAPPLNRILLGKKRKIPRLSAHHEQAILPTSSGLLDWLSFDHLCQLLMQNVGRPVYKQASLFAKDPLATFPFSLPSYVPQTLSSWDYNVISFYNPIQCKFPFLFQIQRYLSQLDSADASVTGER